MNWDAAIDINRTALLRLFAVMIAALGTEAGGTVGFVPQRVRLMVLRLLRPAESALRRLVMLEARDLPMPDYVPGPAPDKPIPRGKGGTKSLPFPLFDPRKKFGRGKRKRPAGLGPRIFFLDGSDPPYTAAPEKTVIGPDDPVSAEALCQRLDAFFKALNDLPKQARRLKRAEARRAHIARLKLQGPLRIHNPPGHRERGLTAEEREVDAVLRECQQLARMWIAAHDTS